MAKPSDPDRNGDELWEKLIGLGERSHRKSYYPELQKRLEQLERFRDVLDQSNDAIFLLETPSGRVIDANRAACRLVDMSRAELLETPLFSVTGLGEDPEARDLITKLDGEPPTALSVETVLFSREGGGIPVEVSLNRNCSHDHDCVAAVVRDITERRQAQEVFAERTRLAEVGARVGRALAESTDLDRALQACAEALETYTDAALVRIWTFDASQEVLLLLGSAGMYTHTDGRHGRIDVEEYPHKLGVICRERRPCLTNEVIGDPHFHDQEWARREGIVAFAGYPLILQERLVGVIALFAKIALTDTALDTLSSVADTIAIGIERYNTLSALSQALDRAGQDRDRIDAIVHSMADGLVVTDTEGRVALMNRRAERLFGVVQGLARGRPIGRIVRNRTLREHLTTLFGHGGYPAVVDVELSDHERGEVRSVQARTSQVRSAEGNVSALVTIFRDVTREKEVDRMKSEFITVAAHELRTPLTTVKGFSELLLNSPEPPAAEVKEYASHIFNKAGVLERIVDELLDLSRIEAGGALSLNRTPCDPGRILEQVVAEYREEFPGFDFRLRVPEGGDELLLDADKIRSVVSGLLDNVTRFCPEGTRVIIESMISGDEYRIVVTDRGPGMSAEQVSRCFDRFYRGESGDGARGGIGLGLTLARTIVESHGGAMRIDSEEGKGTAVSFTLPLEKAGQAEVE